MTKTILLLLFTCLLSAGSYAQTHLKGQRFLDVQGGLVGGFAAHDQVGINGLISTGRYNRQYNAWKVSAGYLQKTMGATDMSASGQLSQFSISWGYEFNLWRNAYRTRFVRGSLQPMATYEVLPVSSSHAIPDSAYTPMPSGGRFLLGAEGSVEVEFAPVVFSIRQRWLPKSGVQPFYTLVSVGWRWHGL
ncbi:conjugal transfer protein TraO [Spirosoma luteolum]